MGVVLLMEYHLECLWQYGYFAQLVVDAVVAEDELCVVGGLGEGSGDVHLYEIAEVFLQT